MSALTQEIEGGKSSIYIQVLANTSVNAIFYPMIEVGSTPTEYEPYQGDTYNITLPEAVYGGTVDCVTGEGEKIWNNIAFNGTEVWQVSASNIVLYNATSKPSNTNPGKGYCSHFSFSYSYGGDCIFITGKTVCLGVSLATKYTLEEWKSYLAAQYAAGTPITIVYQLATPETFEITPHPILALPGANTLYTDGDRVAVTGKQDLTYTLRQIQEQLAAVSGVTEALTGTD